MESSGGTAKGRLRPAEFSRAFLLTVRGLHTRVALNLFHITLSAHPASDEGEKMPHDRRMSVKTFDGVLLFQLTSHTVSEALNQGGNEVFHVQLFIPDDIVPRTAEIHRSPKELTLATINRTPFRFRKDSRGVYAYVAEDGSLKKLEQRSVGHISILAINYEDYLKVFRRRPV